ncbi:response regulator transcription factor [Sphingomonas quercus]|uniref:Response regulator transcription factor n=1 Tax=Sphingomonas quercus TaxID=2842451 RepID=A0ABS6BEQ7_9SPHN|nr:response regulator transcription factor [Sphingomonas quercus]MBU3076800.1 response regulator transcription factor [Sphingomonas quercus]
MNLNLLMVEDDAPLAAMLSDELQRYDHQVTVVGDGGDALLELARHRYDAVILDRMLPKMDGISVLERLRREQATVPIIMLSALARAPEKVEGLEAGADDYIVKPVTVEELNARLHAVLRGRRWNNAGAPSDTIEVAGLVISPARFRVWRDGKPILLPKVEFKLLAELARNAETVLTRAMLLERVWGYDFIPTTNIVDVYIRRLRIKLTEDGSEDPVVTVRGVGYMLSA